MPRVPWQVTGNHWLTVPCIHPGDASIHAVSVVHAGLRGAVEFAGGAEFIDGEAPALLRLTITIDGVVHSLGAEGIAWEREAGWIPSFTARLGTITVRGTICAPHGMDVDLAGFVIELAISNVSSDSSRILVGGEGHVGHRAVRVRTARPFGDVSRIVSGRVGSVVLAGEGAESAVAVAIGASDPGGRVETDGEKWSIATEVDVAPGATNNVAFHVAIGQERDGAEAVLEVMRRRGARNLIAATRSTLGMMAPSTGNAAADRLIGRHMFFAYFCAVARAVDDAHLYVMRSRIPWNDAGLTIRDWDALRWIMPAVQLADPALARELLLRVCDLHGYAPGAGVHYIDGSLFQPGFSLEGAAAFPVAVDDYISQSGDDKIVEEPMLADSLYNAYDDINARKHPTLPLFSTEINPDGSVPAFPYTSHGNAVVALALDVLAHTLDEKTAEKVPDPAAVRAALLRHFSSGGAGGKNALVLSSALDGEGNHASGASALMYWLPLYDLMDRDDSVYRRTVKPLENESSDALFLRVARLVGPDGSGALDWLRRAPLDGGLAAESVDEEGRATESGGDAAMSGLIAYTAWYAVHALGATL